MSRSLEKRLSVWVSVWIVVAGALAASFSFAFAQREANELQDAQLQQIALLEAMRPAADRIAPYLPRDDEDAETHLVVKALGGNAVLPDARLDLQLPAELPDGLQTLEDRGRRWRVLVRGNQGGQRFGVAQRMTVRDEIARDSALRTLVPLLVLMPLMLLLVRFVIHRSFRPLAALSREVDRLGEATGPTELALADVPAEILPLVQAVNRSLQRLGTALDQQRRLVADAAHELRSPVAALMVQAENLRHADIPTAAQERLDALQQGLARMSATLEQLLSLARLQGAPGVPDAKLRLDRVARHAIETVLPLAQAKGIDIGCLRLDPTPVRGAPLQAQALMRNAIDNAVRYTPAGGSVDVSVFAQDGEARFVVEDTGPGLAADDIERVFQPFVRVLGSHEIGSGLGLTIARSAATALGGRIELGRRSDGASGLRFHYRQPVA